MASLRGDLVSRPQVGLDVSALDESFKSHAHRGIGRYVRELHRAIATLAPTDLQMTEFSHRSVQAPWPLEAMVRYAPLGRQSLRQLVAYPSALGRGITASCSLLHFPAHMDAPPWSATPCAVTVLDLIPLVLADSYRSASGGWRFRLARWVEKRGILNARLLFAISECTARDVVNLLGVPRERIVVTPLGVDARFFQIPRFSREEVCQRFALPSSAPLLLYLGGIDPRKNVQGVLETVAALRSIFPTNPPHLIMAGAIERDKHFPEFLGAVERLRIADLIHQIGFVPDEFLPSLLHWSDCFLFLSLYEGFGLPPLEAMAAGGVVVSSTRSSLAEVLHPDAALGVDPENRMEIVEAVRTILSDPDRARILRATGPRHAAQFSWERTARLTLDGYRRILGGNT